MAKKVKGLILKPGKRLEEIEIEDSLQGMYDAIGCDIIQVPVIGTDKDGHEWQMILDEEGKVNGRQIPNVSLTPFGLINDTAFGPILFLGLDDERGNCDLTEASVDEIHERLWERSPRKFDNDSSFTVERFGKEK